MIPELVTALTPLFAGGVWPLRSDEGTKKPFCTVSRVGGQPSNTFCGNTDKENGRFQFNVWADSMIEADDLMKQVRAIVCSTPFLGTSLGEREWAEGYDTRTFGTRQDFSIWFTT